MQEVSIEGPIRTSCTLPPLVTATWTGLLLGGWGYTTCEYGVLLRIDILAPMVRSLIFLS